MRLFGFVRVVVLAVCVGVVVNAGTAFGQGQDRLRPSIQGPVMQEAVTDATGATEVSLMLRIVSMVAETVFWQSIVNSTNRADFEAYLDTFPGGMFAALARTRLVAVPAARVSASVEPDPPRPGATAASDPAELAAGARIRDCSACPELVVVPAGTFRMGSTSGQDDERPVHEVSLDAFALGRFEVTRKEYGAFVAATGHQSAGCGLVDGRGRLHWDSRASWGRPGFEQDDSHPVVCVSWTDAQAYVRWLSMETGKGYRLPSEAEWEYGARADTATERYWDGASGSQCDYANAGDRALLQRVGSWPLPVVNCADGVAHTAPAGTYGANAFGLHDMLGNVWEWTADCWRDKYQGAPRDGSAWTSGGDCDRRVLRGGAWETVSRGLRSANRYRNDDNRGSATVGFRVARSVP